MTVSFWLAPGASVNVDGETLSPIDFGLVTETFQVADVPSELLTVRVQLQVPSQPEVAMLASFSVVGSPPAEGSAAV